MTDDRLKPDTGLPAILIALLAVMAGISVANIYYCQPLLNLISAEMGIDSFRVNLMPVLTQIGYALGLLIIVPLGDMINRRRLVLLSFLIIMVPLIAISLSRNLYVLLGASFLTGFFSVSPQVFMPFVSQFARPEEKERKVGLILSGLLTGILASRVISGYVGHLFGWRSMFIIAAAMMGISALVIALTFPNVKPNYNGRLSGLMASIVRLAKDNPRSLVYSVRSGFCFGSFLGLWACLAFRIKEAPFFQGSDVVGMLGLCGIAGALTASNVGKYIPRFGVERVNLTGDLLIGLAWIILLFFDSSYAGLIAGIIIIDIGMQCIQLSNQSATMKLAPGAASRMNTIYMVTYFIGGSLGTFLAGTFWSLWGWLGTISAGILLLFSSLTVTFLSRRALKNYT